MAANANIRAVITAEDRASGVLKGFSNSVEHVGDRIAGVMKTAAITIGAASTAALTFAVKSAANFEQTRIGLENMLGSADKARVLLKDISRFAAETPFEFPELAQATRQLVAFGFSAEDAFSTMKQLGNVSAAVGAPINDLAYLMGTLRAQGRAFTIDIRQFAMRGIPIYEYLGKVFKTNTEEVTKLIEAGKVGFPEVQQAFQLLAGEGGKWGNTMERQSKSLSGLFSTLKDNIGAAARSIVGISETGDIRENSIFARLQQSAKDAIVYIERNRERIQASIERVVNTVIAFGRVVIPIFMDFARTIVNLMERFNNLDPAIKTAILSVMALSTVMGPVLRIVSTLLSPLSLLAGAFGGVATAVGGASGTAGLIGTMARFAGPVGIAITAAGALAFLGKHIYDVISDTRDLAAEQENANRVYSDMRLQVNLTELAQRAHTRATEEAKTALANLTQAYAVEAQASENIRIARENVRLAQEALNTAVNKYGPESAEAHRQTLILEDAQLRLNGALRESAGATVDLTIKNGGLRDANLRLIETWDTLINLTNGLAHNAFPGLRVSMQGVETQAVRTAQSIQGAFSGVEGQIYSLNGRIGELQAVSSGATQRIMQNFGALQAEASATSRSINQIPSPGGTLQVSPRALGGPVTAGRSYLVGERGKPELFVPNQNGRIVNDQDMAKITTAPSSIVNITVSPTIGVYAGTPMERRKLAMQILEDIRDIANQQNTTLQNILGTNRAIPIG